MNLKQCLLAIFIIAVSCKKTSTSDCISTQPFKADFEVGEVINGYGFAPTDTIVTFSFAAKSKEPYLSYQWKIGNDPRVFTGSTASLTFTGTQVGQTFPVTLTATGRPQDCNTAAVQTNTVTKNVTVMYPRGFPHENLFTASQLVTLPFLGQWQGSFTDAPTDTFSIYIVNNGAIPPSGSTGSYGFRIYNLPKGCSGNPNTGICGFVAPTEQYYGYPLEVAYRNFYSEDIGFGTCCPKVRLNGGIDPADYNKIKIYCFFYTPENGSLKETVRIFSAFRK